MNGYNLGMMFVRKHHLIEGIAALFSAAGAVTSFSGPVHISRPVGSDVDRMRSDVRRVGETMRKVISQEHEKQTKAAS